MDSKEIIESKLSSYAKRQLKRKKDPFVILDECPLSLEEIEQLREDGYSIQHVGYPGGEYTSISKL